MPLDGSVPWQPPPCTLVDTTMAANYPGIVSSQYQVTYKCLVGIDTQHSAPAVHLP